MRAFSNKLEMDQSLLSKLLQGKRKFSDESAQKVSEFLGVYLQSDVEQPDSPVDYQLMKEDPVDMSKQASSTWPFLQMAT